MAPETKEKEGRALTTQKPAEIMPRTHEMERWFDRMVDDFWRRPFPSLRGRSVGGRPRQA